MKKFFVTLVTLLILYVPTVFAQTSKKITVIKQIEFCDDTPPNQYAGWEDMEEGTILMFTCPIIMISEQNYYSPTENGTVSAWMKWNGEINKISIILKGGKAIPLTLLNTFVYSQKPNGKWVTDEVDGTSIFRYYNPVDLTRKVKVCTDPYTQEVYYIMEFY